MPERRPQPEAGMRARHDGHCARCDAPIVRNKTRIVFQPRAGDLRRVRERGWG